ncbi:MAG TPA: mechanosensitive ion channel [bacterium]
MDTLWDRLVATQGEGVVQLLIALAVLLIGWVGSLVLAAVVRGVFARTGLDRRISAAIGGGDDATPIEPGKWIAKGLYYFLMLLVFVAFLEKLGFTIATEPFNLILVHISNFAPRVLVALVLLLAAWIIARVVKSVTAKLLSLTQVDERLGESAGLKGRKQIKISETVSEAGYWLVFLFFLPAVLGALAMEGLLAPVQQMLNEVLGFLPNLFAGMLIFSAGWLIARIVQRVVTSLLAAAGADQLAARLGVEAIFGKQKLSGLIGLVVYILILIPAAIAGLDALELAAISGPATQMLNTIFNALPMIFTAGLVVFIAYLVGRFAAGLVTNLLTALGFNTLLSKIGIGDGAGKGARTPSEVVGYLALVAVVLFAVIEAARLLGFVVLAELLADFITLAGQVLLGLVIFGVGLFLATLAENVIRERNAAKSGVLAAAAKISIVVLATAMALRQMGLANEIIQLAFGLLLGSVAAAVALAFGLGSRDIAAKELGRWLDTLRSNSK